MFATTVGHTATPSVGMPDAPTGGGGLGGASARCAQHRVRGPRKLRSSVSFTLSLGVANDLIWGKVLCDFGLQKPRIGHLTPACPMPRLYTPWGGVSDLQTHACLPSVLIPRAGSLARPALHDVEPVRTRAAAPCAAQQGTDGCGVSLACPPCWFSGGLGSSYCPALPMRAAAPGPGIVQCTMTVPSVFAAVTTRR